MMADPDTRLVSNGMRTIGKWIHLLLATVVIFGLAYLLGHTMLSGPPEGGDSALHIGYATWLNQYFPRIPHWYPLQGGGESLLHGYPIVGHLLVVLVHRLSNLSILQAFRLVTFLSVPLAALGVYLFGWAVLRRRTIGLIAAVFYLLAPITWTWAYDWGFFAQSVAMVFLPLGLICFDRYFSYLLEKPESGRRRIWFALVVLFLVVTMLTHIVVGAGMLGAIALYSVASALVGPPGRRRQIVTRGISATFFTGITAALVLAFYLVPFYRYGQVANREGLNMPALHQVNRLPIAEFLGVSPLDPYNILTRMANPLVTTVFFMIGVPLAVRYSRKALALALVAGVGAVYSHWPEIPYMLTRISSSLAMVFGFRSMLVVVMILYPVGAAFGVWALARTLVSPTSFLRRKASVGADRSLPRLSLGGYLTSGLALTLAGVAILQLGSAFPVKAYHVSYGPLPFGIDLRDIWDRERDEAGEGLVEQLALENWPEFTVSDDDPSIAQSQHLATLLPNESALRIDVSPYLGRLAQDLTAYSNASQINTYTFQISLIHAMWGYQQSVFYSRGGGDAGYGNPRTLNGAAQWFGTEYVFLDGNQDPIETYETAGWEPVHREGALEIWRYPDAPGMATLTSRPAILVVGKPEADVYPIVFRLANDGMVPYEEALLVEGESQVDRYTLEDLQSFDALFLHGYDYKNSRRAWEILAAYVEQGGSLFVDTGWEFWIPEWEFERAPEVLPVKRLTWTDYGMTDDYRLGSSAIAGELDVSLFNPLAWEGQPWTLSGAEMTDVRDWAQVVLSAAGRPLIVAGEFGQGRVVWSGMNLIGHGMYLGRNEAEIRLLHNLLGWLTERREGAEAAAPSVERGHPDRVEFSLSTVPGDTNWLYWREAYYPNWHAYRVEGDTRQEIPIYRAGPGFMLMPVETAAAEASVVLQYEPALIERIAGAASLLAFGLLGVLVLDGLLASGGGLARLGEAIARSLPRPFLGDGPIHDWVERHQAKNAPVQSQAPARDPYPEPSPTPTSMALHGAQNPRPDGEDGPSVPIDLPAGTMENDGEESTSPSWLRHLSERDGSGADEILSRRRLRKTTQSGGSD